MPPDSSSADTKRKGIILLPDCRDSSDENVHAYIPCNIQNVQRETLWKYNFLTEKSDGTWTTIPSGIR